MTIPTISRGIIGSALMQKLSRVIQKGFVWNRIINSERGISWTHTLMMKKLVYPVKLLHMISLFVSLSKSWYKGFALMTNRIRDEKMRTEMFLKIWNSPTVIPD